MKRATLIAFFLGLLFSVNTSNAQVSCGCECGWYYFNTGVNMSMAMITTQVTLDGTTITGNGTTQDVFVGVFYDSLGYQRPAAFVSWTGAPTALSIFGDDSSTPNPDGFAAGESLEWKICVVDIAAGTHMIYDAEPVYNPPIVSTYTVNAIGGLGSLNAVSSVGVEAIEWITPQSGCGLSNAETVQVSFWNDTLGVIAEDIIVSYSINGGAPVEEIYTLGLNPGDTVVYTFNTPADFSALVDNNGVYSDSVYNVTFTVDLSVTPDVDSTNNTITTTVTNVVPPEVSFTTNLTNFPQFPNFCFSASMAPVPLIGTPTGGTFSGIGASGNYFIPDMAKSACPTCDSFEVCYTYYDPITDCMGEYCQWIYLYPYPSVSITNTDLDLCVYETEQVIGIPSGGTYNGSAINTATGVFTPVIAGTYPITYTYTSPTSGCTSTTSTANFVAHSLPNATIANLNRAYCSDGDDVILEGSPSGGVYSSPTAFINGDVFSPSSSSVSTHSIVYNYTDAYGCSDDYAINVKVFNGNPTLDFTGLDIDYCLYDDSVQLTPVHPLAPTSTAWTGANNGWFNPSTIGFKNVTLSGIWTYAYFGDTAYCDNSETHSTVVYALPQIDLSLGQPISNIGSIETAEPDTVLIAAGPGYNYIWNTGSTGSSIGTGLDYGMYSCTVTDNHECSNVDSIAITGTDIKILEVINPSSYCEIPDPCSEPVTVLMTNPGTYTFVAGDKISFTGKINNNLVQSQIVEIGIGLPEIAPGDTLEFTFNQSLPGCASLSNPGDYIFRVVGRFNPNTTVFQLPDVNHHNDTVFTTVTNGGLPVVDLGADITSGSPDTITLDAGAGFVSYLWTSGAPGSIEQTVDVTFFNGQQEFCVTVEDKYGCEASDCIIIFNGIEDLANSYSSFNIFPNPAQDMFMVTGTTNSNEVVRIAIYDVQGKLIKEVNTQQVNQFSYEFDASSMAKGIYHVKVFNGIENQNSTLIIQ